MLILEKERSQRKGWKNSNTCYFTNIDVFQLNQTYPWRWKGKLQGIEYMKVTILPSFEISLRYTRGDVTLLLLQIFMSKSAFH